MNLKQHLKTLGLIIVIVSIATFIDWLVHSSREAFYVPAEYYRNKIIFATLFGSIALFVFRNVESQSKKAILFALVIAVSLQVKYFLLGYDLFFVFLFMVLHFLMLLLPALYFFKRYPKYF